jgi:HrpA-like RNA helicase
VNRHSLQLSEIREENLLDFFPKEKLLSIVENHPLIIIVQGNTGSGRSIQIPQDILDDHIQRNKTAMLIYPKFSLVPRAFVSRSSFRALTVKIGWLRRMTRRATVVVFLPDLLEIETIHRTVRHPRMKSDANPTMTDEPDQCELMNYNVIPLHSNLSIDDEMNIFTPMKNAFRQVQLALFLTRTETFLFRSTDSLNDES